MRIKAGIFSLIIMLSFCLALFLLPTCVLADADSKDLLTYGTALTLIANNNSARNAMETVRGYNYWVTFTRKYSIIDREYAISYVYAIGSDEPIIVTNTDILVAGALAKHVYCAFAFSYNPYASNPWNFSNINHKQLDGESNAGWKGVGLSEYVTPNYTGNYSSWEPVPSNNYDLAEKQGKITYYPTLQDLYNGTNGESYPPYNYFTGDYWNYTLENETLEPVDDLGGVIGVRVDTGNIENGVIAFGGADTSAKMDISYYTQFLDILRDDNMNPQPVSFTLPQSLGGKEIEFLNPQTVKQIVANAPIITNLVKVILFVSLVLYAWRLWCNLFDAGQASGDNSSE